MRLASLDAFRGATMLYMASEIWNLPKIAAAFPDSPVWQFISFHTSHAAWTGGSAWDLIQPSFMFMVGVALPFSVANRRERGQGLRDLWRHAIVRSFILMALGIFLRSTSRNLTNFTFEDVLTQIGLGYPVLFALAWASTRVQALSAAAILVGYWAAFALYPTASPDLPFTAHWDKNANLASAFDQWFLNLFPREKPFLFNGGGYQTLNFIPSLGTMIFGLLAGGLLRDPDAGHASKLRRLALYGAAAIALGWLLGVTGICPVVKRIWTPSWALFSTGWVLWLLAAFYWLADVRGVPTYALRAVGMNSIAMYTMVHLWDQFLARAFRTHLGWNLFQPLPEMAIVFWSFFLAWAFLWWCCVWMDRRRLYIRI